MFEMFLINLAPVNLVQLHIFWKLVHAIHLKQPPKGFPRAKRILWKFSFSGCFPKAKKKQCDQKVSDISDQIDVGKLASWRRLVDAFD